MTRSTKSPFAALALTAAALTISVPVAAAQSPDAFERAVLSQQQSPTFVGSPDAIDRAVAAREANRVLVTLDVRERALTERPASTTTVSPDAFERALVTHSDGLTAQTAAMLDRRERGLVGRSFAVESQPAVATTARFDWSDFSVGAGTGIGFALLLIGLGVLAIRRSHERVTTA